MAVLAIDTATEVAAVAIGDGADAVVAVSSRVPRGHSRVLQPAIQFALDSAGLTTTDLTSIVVGIGPGSYTGVRLGVATAKAMASVLAIPLLPVSTLWGLAAAGCPRGLTGDTLVLPMLFARRQRAFGAVYRLHAGKWTRLVHEQVRAVADWTAELARLRDGGAATIIVHDFVERHGVLEHLEAAAATAVLPIAAVSGNLGPALVGLAADGQVPAVTGQAVHGVTPDYALPVEAEAKLVERSQGTHDIG